MSFAAPAFLLLLLLVPLGAALALAARRRRRRFAVRFPAAASLAAVAGREGRVRRHLPGALLALAVAALALALARPERTVDVPVRQATIVLVTDASRSMLAEDVEPSRLDAARRAARRFLEDAPEALRVGLVGFSTIPHSVVAPTQDRAEVGAVLDGLVADGGTATGDAVAAALGTLEETEDGRPTGTRPPAAIVLLSDGESREGRDPVGAAREAGRAGVPVYTVALGTADGVIPGGPLGVTPVPPDPETLREMSRVSGGRAFTTADGDELSGIYEELGRQVGTKPERRELTAAFAGAGLLLLLGAAGLTARRRALV